MVAFLPEIVEFVDFADFPPAEASSPSSSGRIADAEATSTIFSAGFLIFGRAFGLRD